MPWLSLVVVLCFVVAACGKPTSVDGTLSGNGPEVAAPSDTPESIEASVVGAFPFERSYTGITQD